MAPARRPARHRVRPHASLEEGRVGLGHIDGGGDERGDVRPSFLPRASHPRLRQLGLEKIPRGGQRRLEKPLVAVAALSVRFQPQPASVASDSVSFQATPRRSRTAAAPPSSATASASSTRAAVRLTVRGRAAKDLWRCERSESAVAPVASATAAINRSRAASRRICDARSAAAAAAASNAAGRRRERAARRRPEGVPGTRDGAGTSRGRGRRPRG